MNAWRLILWFRNVRARARLAIDRVLTPFGTLLAVVSGIVLFSGYAWIPSPRGWHAIELVTLYVVGGFALGLLARLLVARSPLAETRERWLAAGVGGTALLALAARSLGIPGGAFLWWPASQAVLVYLVLTRAFRGIRYVLGQHWLTPIHVILASFVVVILCGTALLLSPKSTPAAHPIDLVDALFTATSATCVTGLVVRSTGPTFTPYGQMVILGLIQIGGLGIMTFAGFFVTAVGRGLTVRDMVTMSDALSTDHMGRLDRILVFILLFTLVAELLGAGAIYVLMGGESPSGHHGLYWAVFHAISAFCNAGFALQPTSLVEVPASVTAVVAGLVIVGGLGFPVIHDLFDRVRGRLESRGGYPRGLLPHTKAVLSTSAVFLVGGAVLLFVFELATWSGGTVSLGGHAAYQSVTARTAGFNTLDIAGLSASSLFIVMMLMFVGASPGSTGGGIKTTTFLILHQRIWALITNRTEVEVFRRTIPRRTIHEAIVIFLLAAGTVCGAIVLLLHTEAGQPFSHVLFECISAFATVGLSAGVTPELTSVGKLVVVGLMYVGRLGPLSLVIAARGRTTRRNYRYPEGRIAIG